MYKTAKFIEIIVGIYETYCIVLILKISMRISVIFFFALCFSNIYVFAVYLLMEWKQTSRSNDEKQQMYVVRIH